jgi:hypothetical protein
LPGKTQILIIKKLSTFPGKQKRQGNKALKTVQNIPLKIVAFPGVTHQKRLFEKSPFACKKRQQERVLIFWDKEGKNGWV